MSADRGVRAGRSLRRWGLLFGVGLLVAPLGVPAAAGAVQVDAPRGEKDTASAVRFARADLWSLHISSHRLLADVGYAIEYAFEFLDEEELRVQALGPQEIVSGRILTILDGQPVEAEIHLRGEPLALVITADGYRVVAAWRGPDRLIPADLPPEEIQRRLTALNDLRAETKRRLGLARFRPSQSARVRVRIAGVDTIALVPTDDTWELYEVQRPMTSVATEVLIAESAGRHWEITWGQGILQVQVSPVLATVKTTVSYHDGEATGRTGRRMLLSPSDAAQIANTAFAYLQAARRYFGTSSITAPLPIKL